jgi:hypothetical protein
MFKNKLLFSITFLFLSLFNAIAQEEKKAVLLKIILEKISSQHNIKFNYIEDEIVVYSLEPPKNEWTLETKINYIKTETKLQFKVINATYFTIYNDKKLDKPLCGFLIDSDTKQPIENAVISILKTTISSTSDEKGYFELPTVSPNTIQIKHLSYQSITMNPEDLYTEDCLKIKLLVITEELEEVVTQRYLTKGISKKNDGSFEIKPKKFGILPGLIEPDVLQAMQQIPGIYSENETISNINVRGGTHDQNLFLWNGIRMFQTGHFFGLISAFNSSLAQNIIIAKNGSSAFYGESVSSLVAISSHSKTIEKSNNTFSTNLISAEFYSKIKISEKASFEFSGRRSFTDVFSSTTYKNYRNRIFQNTIVTNLNSNQIVDYKSDEDFYFYDFTAQYQQKIGAKHELSIDAIAIQNSLAINQFSISESKNSDLGQQNFGGTINWKTNWNTKNWSQIHFYTSYYNLDATNESIQNNQIFEQRNTILDMGFQLKNSHQISETITLDNGYQFNEIGVTNFDEINAPFFSRKIKEVLRNHALVIESNFKSKNKKTFLTTGIRANYFEKFKTLIIEPRIQFGQSLSKNVRLEILGEQKSQTLSQIIDLQQDFLGIEKRRWTLANNSTIPIQKSNQISFGFTFKKNNWLVTLDNFYKKITGITSSSQGFQNQFEFVKTTGNYTVLGSEVLVQKNFNRFYSWISYSFNDNNYSFEALSNSRFSNNLELVHTVSWAGIYDWKSLKIALGSKWHSGKPFTTPYSNSVDNTDPANPIIEYNTPNNNRLKDYFQLNFSASKDWDLSKKITLQTSVSVLNILNTKNVINRFYRVNTTENTIESVDTYSLERTPNVNIKISF